VTYLAALAHWGEIRLSRERTKPGAKKLSRTATVPMAILAALCCSGAMAAEKPTPQSPWPAGRPIAVGGERRTVGTASKQVAPVLARADVLVVGSSFDGCFLAQRVATPQRRVILTSAGTSLPREMAMALRPWVSHDNLTRAPADVKSLLTSCKESSSGDEIILDMIQLTEGLEDRVLDKVVGLYYDLHPCGIQMAGRDVTAVIFGCKGGLVAIEAGTVVDCTPDGSLAALAGAETRRRESATKRTVVRYSMLCENPPKQPALFLGQYSVIDQTAKPCVFSLQSGVSLEKPGKRSDSPRVKSRMLAPSNDHKILDPIVELIAIQVMNNLVRPQRSFQVGFHHQPVFRLLLARDLHIAVAIGPYPAAASISFGPRTLQTTTALSFAAGHLRVVDLKLRTAPTPAPDSTPTSAAQNLEDPESANCLSNLQIGHVSSADICGPAWPASFRHPPDGDQPPGGRPVILSRTIVSGAPWARKGLPSKTAGRYRCGSQSARRVAAHPATGIRPQAWRIGYPAHRAACG